MRRYGRSPVPARRYRIRPGAYAVLMQGNAVLLTHQMDPQPEFQLPGGGIDPGEGPIEALHRETREETGWRIAGIRRLTCYRRFTYMPEYDLWAEKICHIFLAQPVIRLGPPLEGGHTAVWMPLSEAPAQVASPGDRAVLQTLLR